MDLDVPTQTPAPQPRYAFVIPQTGDKPQLKAAFLLNFAKFIEWLLNGHDAFGSALDTLIHERSLDNRELPARGVNDPPDLGSCDLVLSVR